MKIEDLPEIENTQFFYEIVDLSKSEYEEIIHCILMNGNRDFLHSLIKGGKIRIHKIICKAKKK